MKILFAFVAILCTFCAVRAENPSKNPFGYTVEIEGENISFEEVAKAHLGKRVAVHMKPGFPNRFVGGPLPKGALVTDPKTNNRVWIGELHAITKDGIRMRWYYEADRTSLTEYGAEGEEIDFIVVEAKKTKG